MASNIEVKVAKFLFTEGKRLLVYRRLASLIRNGTNVDDAVSYLYKRASKDGKKPNEPDAIVFADWQRKIRNGRPFSEAISNWAPVSERMIIAAGEKSGMLDENLMSVCKVVEGGRRMKKAVYNSLFQPIMLLLAAIGVLMLFGLQVIPTFAKLSDPHKWQGAAYSMYLVSQFVTSVWLPIGLGALLGFFVAMFMSMPRMRGKFRVFLDKIPPYSTYRMQIGSGFIISLAAMIKSGEPIQKCMMELRKTASPYLRERLDTGLNGIRMGVNLGLALERAGHDFPDKDVIEELVLYSNQSGFDTALEIIGNEWLDNGVKRVEAQAEIMNGFAKLVMGAVVIWIVYGTFGLQNAITDSVNHMSGGI